MPSMAFVLQTITSAVVPLRPRIRGDSPPALPPLLPLSGVRNDVGGHFGLKAARYAVENFRPGVAGTFELNEIRRRGATRTEIRLKFAGEIVATATFSSLPGTTEEESSKKEYDRLWRIVKEGYKRATEAAHVVAVCHLWGRFG